MELEEARMLLYEGKPKEAFKQFARVAEFEASLPRTFSVRAWRHYNGLLIALAAGETAAAKEHAAQLKEITSGKSEARLYAPYMTVLEKMAAGQTPTAQVRGESARLKKSTPYARNVYQRDLETLARAL
jgi:hypothetical protein